MSPSGPPTVLVIEDDEDILYSITTVLESEGYVVRTARNGLLALESLEQRGMPDVILLDMRMPVMDGWRFAEEFHARYGNEVPIVVMTAAADAEARAKGIAAEGWVGKPFKVDDLIQAITRVA